MSYKNIYCTMQESIDLCNIIAHNSRGPYVKYPKLVELYVKLFGMLPKESLHNSLNDVIVTLRCFLKLRYDKEENMDEIKQQMKRIETIQWMTQMFMSLKL